MKKHYFLLVAFFLIGGLFSLYAQDLIVLRDGTMIEAKVLEISSTEIRYKRFDNIDGPTIVISKNDVLSIRYENGTSETFNTGTEQSSTPAEPPQTTALDPNKFYVGINANPGGLLGSGPSISVELSKGKFFSDISLMVPFGLSSNKGAGFGIAATANYFWHSRLGGFYLGGGLGYTWKKEGGHVIYHELSATEREDIYPASSILSYGLNLGYKFVMKSGLFFRTGALVGGWFDFNLAPYMQEGYNIVNGAGGFYYKPDLAIGYSF